VVGEYSNLKLTFPSDKLTAIAGVAKQLQQVIGSIYLAGIWGGAYLKGQLLWETARTRR
jgi:hypothetical protein